MTETSLSPDLRANSSDDTNGQLGDFAGAQRLERRLLIALSGGVLLAVSWIGQLLGAHTLVSEIPASIGAIILVIPLLSGAWGEIKKGKPSIYDTCNF